MWLLPTSLLSDLSWMIAHNGFHHLRSLKRPNVELMLFKNMFLFEFNSYLLFSRYTLACYFHGNVLHLRKRLWHEEKKTCVCSCNVISDSIFVFNRHTFYIHVNFNLSETMALKTMLYNVGIWFRFRDNWFHDGGLAANHGWPES